MTLDTEDAAKYLHCSTSRIQELVASGLLRGCRVGRSFIFKPEWLDSFMEEEADRQRAEAKAAQKAPIQSPTRKPRQVRRALPDLSQYEASA